MRITSVHYSRLRSFGRYENERVGATADVDEGENSKDVLDAVKSFVYGNMALADDRDELQEDISRLQARKRELERGLAIAEERYQAAKAFLDAHGLTSTAFQDEVPF